MAYDTPVETPSKEIAPPPAGYNPSGKDIQRYTLEDLSHGKPQFKATVDGPWVKWEDVKALLARPEELRREQVAWRAHTHDDKQHLIWHEKGDEDWLRKHYARWEPLFAESPHASAIRSLDPVVAPEPNTYGVPPRYPVQVGGHAFWTDDGHLRASPMDNPARLLSGEGATDALFKELRLLSREPQLGEG